MRLRVALVLIFIFFWSQQALGGRMPYSDLLLFGDSLTDTGNVFLATGGTVPNPVYYPNLGHYTDAATYGELMWQALNLPGSLTPSLAGGTNYAVGGARSRYDSTDMTDQGGFRLPPPVGTPPVSNPSAGSFLGQLGFYFSNTGGVADPFALYSIWMGGNDARDIATVYAASGMADALDLLTQSVGDVTGGIMSLITAGARNLLVPTVSDIGLTPEALAADAVTPGTSAVLSAWAVAYNQALDDALDATLDAFAGVTDLRLWRTDTFDRLGDVLADPGRWGLTNVTDPCLDGYFVDTLISEPVTLCPKPSTYAFYDNVHPSSTIHGILADDFLTAVPAPAPLLLLPAGLVLIAWRRRGARMD